MKGNGKRPKRKRSKKITHDDSMATLIYIVTVQGPASKKELKDTLDMELGH